MSTILYVHQSADLYGSDRVLLTIVTGCKAAGHTVIVAVPCEGQLTSALRNEGVEVIVGEVVKISRNLLTITGLFSLPLRIFKSLQFFDRLADGRTIDIVHSNTLAVLGGAIWARLRHVSHLWHVHEIIQRPRIMSQILPWLAQLFSDKVIANSQQTADWLISALPGLKVKTQVIWNGVDRNTPFDNLQRDRLRQEWGFGPNTTVFGLVGRINSWKGHALLLNAMEQVAKGNPKIDFALIYVGSSAPEQLYCQKDLEKLISLSRIRERVRLLGFHANIWPIWDAIDVAVVPSTQPEPFGLVAIEAMASGKPVIAANHGGLVDIIENHITGILFPPGSGDVLKAAIEKLIDNNALRENMGNSGAKRFARLFTTSMQNNRLLLVYSNIMLNHKARG